VTHIRKSFLPHENSGLQKAKITGDEKNLSMQAPSLRGKKQNTRSTVAGRKTIHRHADEPKRGGEREAELAPQGANRSQIRQGQQVSRKRYIPNDLTPVHRPAPFPIGQQTT